MGKYDLVFRMEYRDVDSVEIELPEGYAVESIPADLVVDTQFGKYSSSVKLSGNKLWYYRRNERYDGRFPAGQYDGLVIDLHMPVADGFGLIEHVRNTPIGKKMPIVVISGSNSGKGETRSMALGATSFLAKPVTTDELVQELYRALEA